jgi:hypothetical protein
MNVYGQLTNAQLQNVAGNHSGAVEGLIWWDTTNKISKIYTGSAVENIGDGKVYRGAAFTLTAVTNDAIHGVQSFLYTGASAQLFSGFGTIGNYKDGTRVTIIGSDDTNTLTINYNDAANGWLTNGSIELGKGISITFEYVSALSRMIEISRNR